MTAPARRLHVIRAVDQQQREGRGWTVLAASAALDSIAVGILLPGVALGPPLAGLAAAVLHVLAVLLMAALPCSRPSRRLLCVAAVLAVPCVGLGIVAVILGTRGRGTAAASFERRRRGPVFTVAAARRLGEALSPCDALDHGDEEQRRAALLALARRADPEAMVLLRRATAGRDPDLALSAALVLDGIRERAERRLAGERAMEVRRAAG